MKILLKTMGVVFGLIAESLSMEMEVAESPDISAESKGMPLISQENVQKILLISHLENESYKILPKDVCSLIVGFLHNPYQNPVLDCEINYIKSTNMKSFKIGDYVKDGIFNLSDPIFSDADNYLIITFDPKIFFKIDQNNIRLAIMIAPLSLIEEKLPTSAKSMDAIMKDWEEDVEYGFFGRMTNWTNLNAYFYLTNQDEVDVTKNNFKELFLKCNESNPIGSSIIQYDTCFSISAGFIFKAKKVMITSH